MIDAALFALLLAGCVGLWIYEGLIDPADRLELRHPSAWRSVLLWRRRTAIRGECAARRFVRRMEVRLGL